MHAYQLDFVNALSAEEQCRVCSELHAAVDERLCSQCEQHVCADCARAQAKDRWLCAPCATPLASAEPSRSRSADKLAQPGASRQGSHLSLALRPRSDVLR